MLLEGLEIKIAIYSEVKKTDRIDSQYFLKHFIANENLLLKCNCDIVEKLGLVTDGNHLTIAENFDLSGIRYLRGQDISERMMLDERNAVFIPESEYDKLTRSHIFNNDVLVTIVGANTGQTALVYNPPHKLTANCKLGFVRVNKSDISPAYLHSFLASSVGQKQILRNIRGGGQTGLILPDFRNLRVPRFSKKLENEIASLNFDAHALHERSKSKSEIAQSFLINNLNLTDWQPTEENTSVKSFSSSFVKTGRLDSEYYQPKFDEIKNKIYGYKNGYATFSELISIQDENFYPKVDESYQYIELADIGNSGEIISTIVNTGDNLPSRARRVVKTNDVIISSIEGSLSKCALITERYNNALCSTGFYVINSPEILPEVLLLLFKSYPFQELMKGRCSGTILTAINKDELQTIPIPILPMDIQKELAKQIQESFKLRQESNHLIEVAKQAVEIAIEQDEGTVMKFIMGNK